MVTSILPITNYSQYLCNALSDNLGVNLLVYADTDPKNEQVNNCGVVKLVWHKSIKFLTDIVSQIIKDKPDVVHLQHEINMYGGIITAVMFPWLLILLKLMGVKTVVTVHGVVEQKIVDKRFVEIFRGESLVIHPWMLKIFFQYLYRLIGNYSMQVIVHTHLLKNVLVHDYSIKEDKISVIPHGVPIINKKAEDPSLGKYLLYFGYIVRRKGLEGAIKGFAQYIKENQNQEIKLFLAGGVLKGQEFAKMEIEKLVKDLGMEERIILTGFIETEKINAFFTNAYAIVMPAALSIAASGPLAQAFAYNKCVVASKIGSLCEEINDKQDGILVQDGHWKEAFEQVIDNPKLVKDIENNVRAKVSEREWPRIARVHMDIYQKIV